MRRRTPRPTARTEMASAAQLYTTDILGLAVALADFPLGGGEWDRRGEARAAVCGSTVALGLDRAPDGGIERLGLRVQACAIGQAAAAIFAQDARSKDIASILSAHTAIADWLAGEGALPGWPGFGHLRPARAYPARHGAIMLPWKAALRALSPDGEAG